ncbi:hypothetical protein ACFV4K_12400, partial [Nocardia sp. NPDC059764]|uniref:hypothetical protein n=1 Tax=Nocardia sp. NPDC059764 TaxID=3346939 RepID=UPI00365D273F
VRLGTAPSISRVRRDDLLSSGAAEELLGQLRDESVQEEVGDGTHVFFSFRCFQNELSLTPRNVM